MQENRWQKELGESLRTADDLVAEGLISREEAPRYQKVIDKYKFLLPRYYARLIDRNNPACPIRRQALPSPLELLTRPDLVPDPLGDLEHRPEGRLTHRYVNRVLLHLTSNCSMYCRFCFRKSLLNELSPEFFEGRLEMAFDYIGTHPDIDEVILSGGDPFLVGDAVLKYVTARLAKIPSVRRVRYHTRVPVTFPVRVTESLAEALDTPHQRTVIVVHFNHPKELTEESVTACRLLARRGFTLLNQSVLLKGVNDEVGTLKALSLRLFDAGIMPYYLHHPDRAEGTAYFDLDFDRGQEIYQQLRAELSGYLLPRYVIDPVDHAAKIPVDEFLAARTTGTLGEAGQC